MRGGGGAADAAGGVRRDGSSLDLRALPFSDFKLDWINSMPWRTVRFPYGPGTAPDPVGEFCDRFSEDEYEYDRRIEARHMVYTPVDRETTIRNGAQGRRAEWFVGQALGAIWRPILGQFDSHDLKWGLREFPEGEAPTLIHVRSHRTREANLRLYENDRPGVYFCVRVRDGAMTILGWMSSYEIARMGTSEPFRPGDKPRKGERRVDGKLLEASLVRVWP